MTSLESMSSTKQQYQDKFNNNNNNNSKCPYAMQGLVLMASELN